MVRYDEECAILEEQNSYHGIRINRNDTSSKIASRINKELGKDESYRISSKIGDYHVGNVVKLASGVQQGYNSLYWVEDIELSSKSEEEIIYLIKIESFMPSDYKLLSYKIKRGDSEGRFTMKDEGSFGTTLKVVTVGVVSDKILDKVYDDNVENRKELLSSTI